jgi:hypothetical protein
VLTILGNKFDEFRFCHRCLETMALMLTGPMCSCVQMFITVTPSASGHTQQRWSNSVSLTLHLLTGYKMYPGVEFYWTILAAIE